MVEPNGGNSKWWNIYRKILTKNICPSVNEAWTIGHALWPSGPDELCLSHSEGLGLLCCSFIDDIIDWKNILTNVFQPRTTWTWASILLTTWPR